jgi:hypothetical protein
MTEISGIQEKEREPGRKFLRFARTETGGFRKRIESGAPD